MSFTQVKRTNILHCDGCEKHCYLDYTFDKKGDCYFPMIDRLEIHSFQDENDNTQITATSRTSLSNKGITDLFYHRIYMLNMARKIAKLCDHYKTK